ncbi:hypothetical protein C8Q78DRAFT_994519 [Trametes maxima]|nr:hypothetical protein C8Q78DRAFT_994519 [Trametes maxima]
MSRARHVGQAAGASLGTPGAYLERAVLRVRLRRVGGAPWRSTRPFEPYMSVQAGARELGEAADGRTLTWVACGLVLRARALRGTSTSAAASVGQGGDEVVVVEYRRGRGGCPRASWSRHVTLQTRAWAGREACASAEKQNSSKEVQRNRMRKSQNEELKEESKGDKCQMEVGCHSPDQSPAQIMEKEVDSE